MHKTSTGRSVSWSTLQIQNYYYSYSYINLFEKITHSWKFTEGIADSPIPQTLLLLLLFDLSESFIEYAFKFFRFRSDASKYNQNKHGKIIEVNVTVDPPIKSKTASNLGKLSATKTIVAIIAERRRIRCEQNSEIIILLFYL